jgi:hypothetical protein
MNDWFELKWGPPPFGSFMLKDRGLDLVASIGALAVPTRKDTDTPKAKSVDKTSSLDVHPVDVSFEDCDVLV